MRLEGIIEKEAWSKVKSSNKLVDIEKVYEEVSAVKRYIKNLLFGAAHCECNRMAAIPQGAFAVLQVRKNTELEYASKYQKEEKKDSKTFGFNTKILQEGRELTPLKYNSKLMNSIWGLYNRYSVHNFKKIDANEASLLACEAWAKAERSGVIGASTASVNGH